MYVTNLGYLEDKSPYIIELPNNGTEELDFGLDYAITILDNNNQPPPDSSNSEAERARKKEEKTQRH